MGIIARFSTILRSVRLNAKQKLAISILIIVVIGIFQVGDYGFSTDEATEMRMVWQNVDLVTRGKPIESDSKYYGTVFNLIAEGAFQTQKSLLEIVGYHSKYDAQPFDNTFSKDYAERMQLKHTLTFLLSLLAYFSVAAIIGLLCGWEYAWIGVFALAFLPRFWGYSFFNPKDIPFAALFTFVTYMSARLIGKYTDDNMKIEVGFNRLILYTLLFGCLAGLLTGVRIEGALLLSFVAVAHTLVGLHRGVSINRIIRFVVHYLLMILAWFGTTIAFYPSSWNNPVVWLFEAVAYLSHHPWSKQVLFDGQQARPADLPWYYLPKYLVITTPIVFQVLFVLGLVLIIRKYAGFTRMQRAAIVMVILQMLFLPIFAIVRGSTMYDGIRQFLFVLPMIALIDVAGFVWLYTSLRKGIYRFLLVGVAVAALVPVYVDMEKLHPYEYVYFDRVYGGVAGAQDQYETDYWALSMREGVEWINENGTSNGIIVVGGPFYPAKVFADSNLSVVSYNPKEELGIPKPFYYIGMSKYDFDSYFAECPVVYQVIREGVPFSTIKRCEEDSSVAAQREQLIAQEIHYKMPNAGEVFLVWGVNGWKVPPEPQRPRGTVLQGKLMYTPMGHIGDTFVTKVKVPSETKVDYIFLITKTRSGQATRVWDANGQPKRDFHTVVSEGGVVTIEPRVDLAASIAPLSSSGGDPGLLVLLIVAVIVSSVMSFMGVRSYLSDRVY